MLFRPDVAVHVAALSEVGGQAFSLIVAITSKWWELPVLVES